MLPLVARRVGRPVRWIQTRSEYFLGATQGRGEQMDFTIAADGDGRVRALRCDMVKDAGAYPGVGGSLPARFNAPSASGPYDIAHAEFGAVSVVTNAPQISAFRGAGRAPFVAALERMVDLYAHEVGLDPAEVRRRNLIRRDKRLKPEPAREQRAVLAELWRETFACNPQFAGENCFAARWQLCQRAYAEYGPDGILIKGLIKPIVKK